ncbi:MAG: hypothetical protein IJZ34_13195 [Lachnospiraceae bacterium]|nr:hypothetical protein [Lachnospiraceae bacterium]
MESFYRTLKRELVQDAHVETPEQAQKEILNILNCIITKNVCIRLLAIFLHLNSKE